MPNENVYPTPTDGEPVAAAGWQEQESSPPAPKRKQAVHEAGHAIVIDDSGWEVQWVNIKDGETKPRMVKANWGDFGAQVAQINWDDATQRENLKPKVLQYVASLVAGHLAENAIDPTERKVSERMTPELLEIGQNGQADRDRVAYFLKRIQCNTMAEVIAAEERATEILDRRQAHHKTLSDILFEHQYVEGDALKTALGK